MKVTYVILTCEAYLPTRGKALRETWLRDVDFWFLSAHENRAERVLGWNTDDSYASCVDKYVEFFTHVDLDADWIVFVDDDTFVYPDRLAAYLEGFDPTQRYYMGYRFPISASGGMSGGAGIVLSRPTYTAVCETLRTQAPERSSLYTDESLCAWVKTVPDVQFVSDDRFHWRSAGSVEEQRTAFTFHYASPALQHLYFTERSSSPTMDISILIPTMTARKPLFDQVLAEIRKQAYECQEIRTEILWESDNGELTLGQKRNVLMDRCAGRYHCFIDDDDILAPDYLKTFVPMITSGRDYDCAAFVGAHYQRGVFTKLFHHSMDYPAWAETPDRYIRTVSPMNLIKTDIVRQVRYKDIRNTEDHEFSKRLMASGLLKSEFRLNANHPIYHYIDGVKQDRAEWTYAWEGPDRVKLWKPQTYNFHANLGASPAPLQFLRLSRP